MRSFVLFLLVLVGVGRGWGRPGGRFCLVLPLSGRYSVLGDRVFSAVRFAVQRANCNVEVKSCDDRGNKEGVSRCMEEFAASGKCILILGGIGDKEGEVVAEEAQALQVPTVLVSGKDEVQGGWTVRLRPTREEFFYTIGKRLKGFGRPVVLVKGAASLDDEIAAALERGLRDEGVKFLGKVTCRTMKGCAQEVLRRTGDEARIVIFATLGLLDVVRLRGYLEYFGPKGDYLLMGGPNLRLPGLLEARRLELEGLVVWDVAGGYGPLEEAYRDFTGHELSTLEAWVMDSVRWACRSYFLHPEGGEVLLDALGLPFEGEFGTYREKETPVYPFVLRGGRLQRWTSSN